ncbi:unnamed protein product [Timema podura]|uniref:Transmembrane protein 43 n=1 Tax=Timema podura TaxID=61482 RepID=A0ABN7P3V4_TIMPD|nr:unnamed protein product [Timema podura]
MVIYIIDLIANHIDLHTNQNLCFGLIYSGQQDETKESFYTNYYYTTNWKDKLISSSKFYVQTGHHNPREFPLMSTVYISEDASVGKFSLSHALKNKFNDFTLFTGDERPERRDIKLHSGLYYHCQDVWNPEVGDIRVQFSYAGKTGEMVSLLAQQTGSVLQPYLTPTGMSVAVVHQGTHTVQQMFQEEHTRNWLSGWPLRGAGWILIFIGGKCATTIINHFGSRHSFLYNILILHFGSTNFAVSLSMSILVIAFPWVWYRPYLGFCLLAVAILPFFYTSITFRHKKVQENMYHKM